MPSFYFFLHFPYKRIIKIFIMEVRDLLGNILQVGDTIVVAEKTYSKTPFLIIGKIILIEPYFNKNGDWISTDIHYAPSVTSDVYLKQLEAENFNHNLYKNSIKIFTISKKNYMNIMKIS